MILLIIITEHVILLYACQEILIPAMIERPMRSPITGRLIQLQID